MVITTVVTLLNKLSAFDRNIEDTKETTPIHPICTPFGLAEKKRPFTFYFCYFRFGLSQTRIMHKRLYELFCYLLEVELEKLESLLFTCNWQSKNFFLKTDQTRNEVCCTRFHSETKLFAFYFGRR